MTKIAFKIPKNYQVPEGVGDGKTFDESVTMKLEGDRLCLTAINGTPMPGYEDEAEEGSKAQAASPDEEGFAQRYAAAMAGGGGAPA